MSCQPEQKYLREALKKKLRDYLGIFPNIGGEGILIPKTFVILTISLITPLKPFEKNSQIIPFFLYECFPYSSSLRHQKSISGLGAPTWKSRGPAHRIYTWAVLLYIRQYISASIYIGISNCCDIV